MSLRLWQLGMHFDPSRGGADRYFHDLLAGLEHEGCPFTAAAFDGSAATLGNASRISLGDSSAPLLRRRSAVRKFGALASRAPGPKVAVSHFALYGGFFQSSSGAIPHVVHFHGPWSGESAAAGGSLAAASLKRWIERRVYRRAARCIALSSAFGSILTGDFGVPAGRVSVVPGFVDLERFRPGDPAELTGSSPRRGRRLIVCVRRLVPRMGLAELLEAFSEVCKRFSDVDLIVGGTGPGRDELAAKAGQLGIGGRVSFPGFIPDADLPGLYRAAAFSIVPSRHLEGFGLVALESLACGTPVLVTPVGGLPEAVGGLRRLVLAGTDPAALAQGMCSALDSPESLPDADACRRHVVQNHAPGLIISRILEIYRQALDV